MITVESLSRTFPMGAGRRARALDRVTLAVARGGVTGVLGPNGAGKTTLFRVISGLLRPEGGRVSVAGHDVASQPLQARARLGLLTEEPGLPDRLTPLWHVALHASLRGYAREEALDRAERVLRELGLEASMRLRHARLSRGTRLKVALARALVHEPTALLLDEPTASLDIETALWMRRTIRQRARAGCAVLLATHNPVEAEQLCDEIVILGLGRVLAAGPMAVVRRLGACAPRLVLRLSGPAREVLEAVRRLPGACAAVAEDDHLVIAGVAAPEAARLVASVAGVIGSVSVLEFRHESVSLEEAYHRIQRDAS